MVAKGMSLYAKPTDRLRASRLLAKLLPRALSAQFVVYLLIGCCAADLACADDPPRVKNEAPPNMAVVGSKLGGTFYAPKPLKEQYDKLTAKVRTLQAEIIDGKITGKTAAEHVRLLKTELEAVRTQIDAEKVFVATAKIYTESETTTFELGPEKSLFIVAENVRLIGWDQPGIKCVLDKTVLTSGDQPAPKEFQGIRLAHQHELATNRVGRSRQEAEAEEQQFLASPDGQKLDAKQLESRKKLIETIYRGQRFFEPLQAKPIDVIEIEGLTYQQGNRQILLEDTSPPDGDRHSWSTWQRHASLTVYVPACKVIGLQGGLAGLAIESVKAPLLVKGNGYRNYEGTFRVRDHEGSLTVENVPLQRIENVRGDVSVTASAYLGNSGTMNSDDTKACYVESPEEWIYHNIVGNLTVHFVRANLTASDVRGRIDINNEFGDTIFVAAKPLAGAAHRLLSQSGGIEMQLADDALRNAPLLALTESGSVRVDSRMRLDEVNFSTWPGDKLMRRGFRGFVQKHPAESSLQSPVMMERVTLIEQNADRSSGLDILSRGGDVRITSSR